MKAEAKVFLVFFLFFVLSLVYAGFVMAQTILADPWAPAVTDQPDGVSYSAAGGAPVTCQLKPIVGGTQMQCDVSPLATGVYPMVITLVKNPTCTNPIPGVQGVCTSWTPRTVNYQYTSEKKSVAPPANLRLGGAAP